MTPDPEDDAADALQRAGRSLVHTVVGLGASAGGMQALIRFFEHMPADSGMSFVVVMHLSPLHESHAAAILQRVTGMPVSEIAEATAIEPDHVYVGPPGHALTLAGNRFHLRASRRAEGRSTSIDDFFQALAQTRRQGAVGIVLSGTGNDGSAGLMHIKEMGGLTMAQDPAEAEHGDMPLAAIATGIVDVVLPVARMPGKLLQLDGADAPPPAPPQEGEDAEALLSEIVAVLGMRTQHDFRHYKRPTVLRRIERRMQANGMATLAAYRDHLVAHPEETAPLLQDMLISVTRFFRDPDAFEALERKALPALQPAPGGEQGLRAWVVGCASGEEAYTLAMLLHEERERRSRGEPFQIFASDIDPRALAVARTGLYPPAIAADLTPARLRRHFVREDGHYRVVKSLRERVLFADHNVLRDPPFSRVDLIVCRNLLIYLDRRAQAAVLETFRFALRPGGVLFLGQAESVEVAGGGAYTVLDKRHHLYRVVAPRPGMRAPTPVLDAPPAAPGASQPHGPGGALIERQPLHAELHQRAALAWAPPSVLVDMDYRILHLSEGVSRWLQVPGGVPTYQLLDHVHPALRLDLRTALFRIRTGAPDKPPRPVCVDSQVGSERVRITVQPVRDTREQTHLLLVLFEARGPAHPPRPPAGTAPASDPDTSTTLQALETENLRLRHQLQEVLEHAETSTEELRAANQELQSVNEELRTTTEELETSREEMQSVNEELTTVNSQLALKVEEVERVNDDLQNLIDANDLPTVFVDRDLRIQRYTPRATDLFNLIASDVGRPLPDITHQLDHPHLQDDVQAALRELRLVEREVTGRGGGHFVARVLPYRTADGQVDGAILTFVDVSALRESQQELRSSAERLRLAVESTRDFAIVTLDEQGLVTGWNPGAARLFGFEPAEILGQPLAPIYTDEDRAAGVPEQELARTREQGRAEDERWHRRRDGSLFYCSGVTTRLEDGRGYAKIARDLTGSKQAALARERLLSNEQAGRRQAEATMEAKELFLAVMSHELKHPLNLIHVNAELLARMPEIRHVPAAVRAAGIIQQTVAGQARIIDDLLDLSRVRTGKLRLERAPVDWSGVVRRIVEAMHTDADAKGLRLHFETCTPAPVSLFDPVRADQVVWNLVSNAIKFTPAGGTVRVALSIDGPYVRLTVSDTGCGIAPGFLDSVFDMFRQESGAGRRPQEGLGIGLALVRELVLAHGGHVRASSEGVGRGAEFSVWVPLHPGGRPAVEPSGPESVLRGLHLLVVDDSADAAESFAMLLRLTGATVATAGNGADALACLERQRIDMLISDLSMPGMTGFELIKAVRSRPDGARVLALAFSGYSRAQDEKLALEAGFDGLLPKPASLEQVEQVVARLLQARGRPPGDTAA